MKQNIYIEKRDFSPNGSILKEAVAGFEKGNQGELLPITKCSIATIHLHALLMDKDCQALGRDGPPGRARSPGTPFMKGWPTGLFKPFNTTIIQPNFIKLKFNHLQLIFKS